MLYFGGCQESRDPDRLPSEAPRVSKSPDADDGIDMEPELSTGKHLPSPASAAVVNAHPADALTRKRKKDSTSLNALLTEFKKAKKERAERFHKKMSLLERLVTAVEKALAVACHTAVNNMATVLIISDFLQIQEFLQLFEEISLLIA
ncbi:hypothetical protein HPB49_014291 [Dermacentor silvarum]|uniref:Uncharacterized protein n=1 Tax=Dermacentor silvarum TaxID=543639 RepID=A0ACB8DJ98_DERSI|nr:hypothetical protein HPB49_014291 [Dermacentor silvarum]